MALKWEKYVDEDCKSNEEYFCILDEATDTELNVWRYGSSGSWKGALYIGVGGPKLLELEASTVKTAKDKIVLAARRYVAELTRVLL